MRINNLRLSDQLMFLSLEKNSVLLSEQLGKVHSIEQPLEISKYISITNKYKQHAPPRSSKKTKWKLLRVATTLNTNRV